LENGNAVLFEHVTRLVLVKIHNNPIDLSQWWSGQSAAQPCSSLPALAFPADRETGVTLSKSAQS
jgi:hypothetical protein